MAMDLPSSISRSSSDDGQSFPLRLGSTSVLPLEEVLEEIAQELQRDVLERESRSMKQLENEFLFPRSDERGDIGMTERGVGAIDQFLELLAGNFGRIDEKRVELQRQFREGQRLPVFLPVRGQRRHRSWDVQSSVGRQSSQNGLFQRKLALSLVTSLR